MRIMEVEGGGGPYLEQPLLKLVRKPRDAVQMCEIWRIVDSRGRM